MAFNGTLILIRYNWVIKTFSLYAWQSELDGIVYVKFLFRRLFRDNRYWFNRNYTVGSMLHWLLVFEFSINSDHALSGAQRHLTRQVAFVMWPWIWTLVCTLLHTLLQHVKFAKISIQHGNLSLHVSKFNIGVIELPLQIQSLLTRIQAHSLSRVLVIKNLLLFFPETQMPDINIADLRLQVAVIPLFIFAVFLKW